jgi:hypothetical protein
LFRWGPSLSASIALEINKNGSKVRKLRFPKVGGGHFFNTFSIEQLIAYFQTTQKKSLNIILLPLKLQGDL